MRIAIAIAIAIITMFALGPSIWVRDPVQLAIIPHSILSAFLLVGATRAIAASCLG